MKKNLLLSFSSLFIVLLFSNSQAQEPVKGSIKSDTATVAILELYTSEGCNSCPAAEKYLKQMVEQHKGKKQFIPLAFHVDYWDYIGWKDPFSNPAFGKRQRDIAIRNQLNTLYTPQFVLHGQDFPSYNNIPDAISIINDIKPQADISLQATLTDTQVNALITVSAINERSKQYGDVYIAIAENNLSSQVTDGENDGLNLQHAHVVRQFLGPFPLQGKDKLELNQTIKLDEKWKRDDLSLIVFAQDRQDGTTHQAIQVPLTELK